MRKTSIFFIGAALSITFVFGSVRSVTAIAEERTVYVGGMSAGFTLKTDGAQVIGLSEITTESGVCAPAQEGGLRVGDLIRKAGGISVKTIAQLNEVVDKSKGKKMEYEIVRNGEVMRFQLQAVQEKLSNRYKIGVLVRESVSGIGTVTYVDREGRFGSLGHSVVGENNRTMEISNGVVFSCNIIGVSKGVRGKAGELRGLFLNDQPFGNADKLCDCGIFGKVSKDFSLKHLTTAVVDSDDAKPGSAYIYSTVNGVEPKRYEIEIVKVDHFNKENKNYVIKIVDEELIAETGGIVQGMSGSPILQEDKLVGAITHVFINDPTRGYGIDIERMIRE